MAMLKMRWNKNIKVSSMILVDDDEDEHVLFRDAVHEVDPSINVIFHPTGEHLLEYLKLNNTKPSIIFLDINMPRLSGIETTEHIKSNPSLSHIPIVIYSTSSSKSDINSAYQAGASLYVVKPNFIFELKRKLYNTFVLLTRRSITGEEDFVI